MMQLSHLHLAMGDKFSLLIIEQLTFLIFVSVGQRQVYLNDENFLIYGIQIMFWTHVQISTLRTSGSSERQLLSSHSSVSSSSSPSSEGCVRVCGCVGVGVCVCV